MKSGNCFKTKSFPGGINHQVSCSFILSAVCEYVVTFPILHKALHSCFFFFIMTVKCMGYETLTLN